MPLYHLKAVFTGRVQGVFFRATIKDHASYYGVVGEVKNCEDGSVEMEGWGDKKTLLDLVERIKKDPGHASIATVAIDIKPLKVEEKCCCEGFRIRY